MSPARVRGPERRDPDLPAQGPDPNERAALRRGGGCGSGPGLMTLPGGHAVTEFPGLHLNIIIYNLQGPAGGVNGRV